ncbi:MULTISPECIES: hypothetical protein [Streptomyces]|uniref:Uncharacterized protein n=2 Tax=Streptomyces TaxID=1883 RepID=A0A6G4AY40_9ACTN|nr:MULTISPECIES: hypothetical protein [Streptomyces]MCQ8195425.1 hypothetical protein [Streptomyces rugosispiralis]NEW77664.1 hypothetical protein [Streptomyces rhizosphaericus]
MPILVAAALAAVATAIVLRITHKVMLRDGLGLAVIAYVLLFLVSTLGG